MNFNQVLFRQLFLEEVSAQRESLTGGWAGDANHPHNHLTWPPNKLFFVMSKLNCQNNLKYCTREHTMCHYFDFLKGNKENTQLAFCWMLTTASHCSSPLLGLFQHFIRVLDDFTVEKEQQPAMTQFKVGSSATTICNLWKHKGLLLQQPEHHRPTWGSGVWPSQT